MDPSGAVANGDKTVAGTRRDSVRRRMIWRFLPLAAMVLLVGIAFGWRAWLQHRRHGTWGIVLSRSGNPGQMLRDEGMVLAGVLLGGQATVAAFWPASITLLVSGPWPELMRIAGAVLTVGGLVLLVAAQLDLGASWRIGIDENACPGLVTDGLYRFCRNPIFLALLLVVAGQGLLLPTLISLLLCAGFYVGVRQQIAAEEAWLLKTYGEPYRDYARQVGRFLPGIGRLH